MEFKVNFAGFTDWIKENATMALYPLFIIIAVDDAEPIALLCLFVAIYTISFTVITITRLVMLALDL